MKFRIACTISSALLLSIAPTGAESADAQNLYLLSATILYGGPLPVALYRVDADRPSTPSLVRKLADGAEFIFTDYDRKRVVVGSPPLAPTYFSIISMQEPPKISTGHIPYDSNEVLPGGIYLLDVPQKGEMLAIPLGRTWRKPTIPFRELTALSLEEPANPTLQLPLDSLKYTRFDGMVGGALPGSQHTPHVRGNPLALLFGDPKGWSLDLPRPNYLTTDPASESLPLYVNNNAVAVLGAADDTIDIFVKDQKLWHQTALPFTSTRIRAFGPWIAAIAEFPVRAPAGRSEVRREELLKMRRGESPGKEIRESEEIIEDKLTVDDVFEESLSTFPGELFLHNGISGASFRIATGQGDSEVLLVTASAVFYRVNDELYRSEIGPAGLGPSTRLAVGPEIVQVHWAFLGE